MAVLLAAPILLSITLLVSGLAKLGSRQATQDAMISLRLPFEPLHRSIASVLPVAEIVLALALWFPAVPLQVMVSVLVAALMLAYLVIIGRALTFEEEVECSCFGTLASPTVSKATLGRNIILTILGVLTIASAATGLMTTALVQTPLALVGLGIALLAAIALTVCTLGGAMPAVPADAGGTGRAAVAGGAATDAAPTGVSSTGDADPLDGEDVGEDGMLDYERVVIPGAVLQKPDRSLVTLHQLARSRAVLLLFVTEGCGPCVRVLGHSEEWLRDLGGVLEIHYVFSRAIEELSPRSTDLSAGRALYDPYFTARAALGANASPSAVLLGADGMLAGGPVSGGDAVIEFVEEIREQLAEAQETGDLPVG
ncbi:TlpA family protein disulfide reductase [Brachybacterium aquaticum]|uniref:Methylamine utilisation protein MauE domain-containing protein n=1 Tax=Brachybacterium aquaticum TaxID=1432564 RepID=A0A841AHJ4_9MICO|nr:MauE/DoxX family redox-associated membrane protein [Brachybacterium aquaticum]MBB5832732.1 hypothetical protein [Brachybacterium aquaticum]